MEQFVNKVEQLGLITLDPLEHQPIKKAKALDISQFLFAGLMLKEKEFKEQIKEFDWSIFQDEYVAVYCSTDAIVPSWAYMMIGDKLSSLAEGMAFMKPEEFDLKRWLHVLESMDLSLYEDQKIVVRAHTSIDPSIYLLLTHLLKPVVKALYYGEAGLPKVIFKK